MRQKLQAKPHNKTRVFKNEEGASKIHTNAEA